jgi:hypothetical protein
MASWITGVLHRNPSLCRCVTTTRSPDPAKHLGAPKATKTSLQTGAPVLAPGHVRVPHGFATRFEKQQTRAHRASEHRADVSLPTCTARLVRNLEHADAFELDARHRHAVALEQRLDARVGSLLLRVVEGSLHRASGFASLDIYGRERLGLSPRKARALLRLERAGRRCNALATASRTGRLSWVQAHTLVPIAVVADAPHQAWIEWARRVTVRRLEDDVGHALVEHETGQEKVPVPPPTKRGRGAIASPEGRPTGAGSEAARRHLGETARPFFVAPRPATRFFQGVLCSVRRRMERIAGQMPTEGDAFEAMLDHALDSWGHPSASLRRTHRVFDRDGWRCTVPG